MNVRNVKNEREMELVKLLKRVKKFVSDTYDIDVQELRIEINDEGILKVFSGDELQDASLLEIDLSKEELTEDNLISAVESDYDYEIRQDLVEKICEDILPNETTEELKGIVRRG